MKSSSTRLAFTLLEMLIVSATIIALSGMVLGLSYRSIKNAMLSNKTVEILSILRTGINQAATEGRSVNPVKHPLLVQSLELDGSTPVMPPWQAMVPLLATPLPFVNHQFPIYGMEYGKCKVLANSGDDRTSAPGTDNRKIFEYLFASTGQLDELQALGAIYRVSANVNTQLERGCSYVEGPATGKTAYRIRGTYFYDAYGTEILAFPSAFNGGKEVVLMSAGPITRLPGSEKDLLPRFGNPNGSASDKARYSDNIFDGRP